MTTIGSLFSGGGGWDAGAVMVGMKPIFAVEYEPWIARWHAQVFGEHVWQASVADVDYRTVAKTIGQPLDILVSSPPCQNTSASGKGQATRRKRAGIEKRDTTVCDPTVGLATLDAVDGLRPPVLFLENNEGYESGATFAAIVEGLRRRGAVVDHRVLKAEDYGVPSGRERLIMRASFVGPLPPWPAKSKPVSWYEAISDLIPTMPLDPLVSWQLEGLAANPPPPNTPLLIAGGNPNSNKRGYVVHRLPHQKAWATQLAPNTSGMRIVDAAGVSRRITPRGIARLQGFPDSYPIENLSRTEAIHVLGNSVPPLLAAQLLAPFAPARANPRVAG
jgi:site-specific DNA-cytosine methylase